MEILLKNINYNFSPIVIQANKKHPSNDECSLLAEDETRTRNNLLGRQGL